MKSELSLVTRNFEDLANPTGSIYETTMIIARRARQVTVKIREELGDKLTHFTAAEDDLEEVSENKEQIELSKSYEKMPKPTITATEEFLRGKIMYRYPDITSS
ncbi:MAG: DNA-directed RNA polymerase subunit omega [Cytophagales bacterium]|nr:DNA-directed RNA polymerase subunit omega [Cytophagales bacterium]